MVKWKRDISLGVFMLLFSISMFFYVGASIGTTTISIKLAQPDVYLKMWLVVMGVLSVILIAKALVKKEDEVLPKIWGGIQIFTIAALAIYLLSMKWIGFFLSSAIFLSTVIIVYSYFSNKIKPNGKARVIQIALYIGFAVVATVMTQYVFAELLGVLLPRFKLL